MEKNIEELSDPRVYEVGYTLVPQIKEEDLDVEIDAVRSTITNNGGLPISEGRANLIELAYPMDKIVNNERNTYEKGYFGWIKFDVSPEKLADIKAGFEASEKIIRFLLISTVKENTMTDAKATNRFAKDESKDKETAPKKKAEKPAEPINEEKLDQQIDDLVVEE